MSSHKEVGKRKLIQPELTARNMRSVLLSFVLDGSAISGPFGNKESTKNSEGHGVFRDHRRTRVQDVLWDEVCSRPKWNSHDENLRNFR